MSLLAWSQKLMLRALSPSGPRGRLLVITYHRVPAEPDPLLPSEPDADQFERHLQQIGSMCRVLPLPDAMRLLLSGRIPDRAACITFDDGYGNNHSVAAPILRHHGMPATFFVTKNAVQGGIMWNDLVIEAVRQAGSEIDLSALGLRNDMLIRDAGLAKLVDTVLNQIKYLPQPERERIALALHGSATPQPAPRLMMTEAEVTDLSRQGFDVGGHTVSHPILAKLEADQAREEINGCAAWLKQLLGHTPVSFAYPNGRPGRDYGPEHVAMVRAAGFKYAVSTQWGCASRSVDPLQVPRVGLPRASNFGQFMYLLRLWASTYR